MFPDPKEDNLNPKIIGSMLLIISLGFLIMAGINLSTVSLTYFFNGQNSTATITNVERNPWPRFRTYSYTLEYHDTQNQLLTSTTTAAGGVFPGQTVDIIYDKNTPEKVYFNGAYLPAISYSLGTLALGIFIALFGLNQFFQKKKPQSAKKDEKPTFPMSSIAEKVNLPLSIRIIQNILMLLLLACIIGYLAGGK